MVVASAIQGHFCSFYIRVHIARYPNPHDGFPLGSTLLFHLWRCRCPIRNGRQSIFPCCLCHSSPLCLRANFLSPRFSFLLLSMPMLEVSADTQVSCCPSTVHDKGADAKSDEKSSKYDPYLIDDFEPNDPENPLASRELRW